MTNKLPEIFCGPCIITDPETGEVLVQGDGILHPATIHAEHERVEREAQADKPPAT